MPPQTKPPESSTPLPRVKACLFQELRLARIAGLVVTLLTASVASGSVPAVYQGAWILDHDASMRTIDKAGDTLTAQERERLIRGLTVDLKELVVEVTDRTMIYTIPGQSMTVSLELQEQGEKRAVFSSQEAGTVILQLDEEGLLNLRCFMERA